MNATELNAERVITDLKRIVRDSEALLHDSGEALGDKAKETRVRLAETVELAKATCQRLEEKAVQGLKAANQVVREHPYESIGIAAAVGLLIGVLVARK
ncbi:MAG: hypothetical protein L0Z50_10455 [Verrucomicrobiales bacterium]|nr:hypothetical protein [Verrucomicrobiales bacterium]